VTRDEALELSEALVEIGQSHTVEVGVNDAMPQRDHRVVKVTPILSFAAYNITQLQQIADRYGYGLAYIQGSFVFTKAYHPK
jgi:hypothetical protein